MYKAVQLLRCVRFLTCVFRRYEGGYSEYALSQFSQSIVLWRETSSRLKCETAGEKKTIRECSGCAKCIFHKRFTVECRTRAARINGQLFWCMCGSVRVIASMYL